VNHNQHGAAALLALIQACGHRLTSADPFSGPVRISARIGEGERLTVKEEVDAQATYDPNLPEFFTEATYRYLGYGSFKPYPATEFKWVGSKRFLRISGKLKGGMGESYTLLVRAPE